MFLSHCSAKYFSITFIHAVNEAMLKTHKTYVVMKGFCFTGVFTCFSSFWSCTVEIPEHTARERLQGCQSVTVMLMCILWHTQTPHGCSCTEMSLSLQIMRTLPSKEEFRFVNHLWGTSPAIWSLRQAVLYSHYRPRIWWNKYKYNVY